MTQILALHFLLPIHSTAIFIWAKVCQLNGQRIDTLNNIDKSAYADLSVQELHLPYRLHKLIRRAQSSMSKIPKAHELGNDNKAEDALDDVSGEDDAEISEIGVSFEFHVQCLMDLVPSLQQTIDHMEKYSRRMDSTLV